MERDLELSAAYARLILQSGAVEASTLLDGVGISQAELADADFLSWKILAAIFRNYAAAAPSPDWAARVGNQFNIVAHGPLGFAALSAPTLGDSLDVLGTYYSVRNNALSARTEQDGEYYALAVSDRTGDVEFAQRINEIVMRIAESLLAAILGHPVGPNVRIAFAHPAPADAKALRSAFDGQVVFDAPDTRISVPIAWRRLPSPLHDEVMYRDNIIKCREIIALRESRNSVAFAVRSILANHFDTQRTRQSGPAAPPGLEEVARALHTTPRTLIRRLAREDTAFRDILEELRRDAASRLLARAQFTVAEVAEMLGYREPANFGRAFRRWFGTSPAAWRRQAAVRGIA